MPRIEKIRACEYRIRDKAKFAVQTFGGQELQNDLKRYIAKRYRSKEDMQWCEEFLIKVRRLVDANRKNTISYRSVRRMSDSDDAS